MRISVIMPVYNAEKYIENTLLSVMNQTFTDIEIIVVNDGSTDGSLEIIERLAKKDSRITILNKRNEGVAKARADGVAISKGDYIQTMDNDDYMYPYALEKLYNKAIETGADMVVGRALFDYVNENRQVLDHRTKFDTITGIELFSLICKDKAHWATWTRLHKASIYREQKILISPDINRAEDVYLTPQLCYYAKKVVAINDTIIKWAIRTDSLSNNVVFSERDKREFAILPTLLADFFRSKGLYSVVEKDINLLQIIFYQRALNSGYAKNIYRECKKINKIIAQNPEYKSFVSPRSAKILNTFKKYSIFGYIRIWKYKIRKPI